MWQERGSNHAQQVRQLQEEECAGVLNKSRHGIIHRAFVLE